MDSFPAAPFPGPRSPAGGGGEAAKWPLGAPAREGHGRQGAPAGPLSARLARPLARPTPSAAPARGRRESGAAAPAPGRGGGEGRTQPGPPCPLAPGRERREQDIPCPGTREGRGGPSSTAQQHPWLGGAPPLPPGAGEPIGPPRPLLLQDPVTQRWELGGRADGRGWDGSFLTGPGPLPSSVIPAATLRPPTYPSSAAPLHRQEKGTETRKEGGVQEGRGCPSPPRTAKAPRGVGGQGKALVPSPPPLETRIAEEGPHKSEIHYCFYAPGTAGDGGPPHLQ